MAALGLSLPAGTALAQRASDVPDPTKDLYPVKRNDKFALDRPVTEEKINTSYNNFYEFGPSKNVAKPAQALKLRPWTVKIDGMVEKPQELGIDDLIRKMSNMLNEEEEEDASTVKGSFLLIMKKELRSPASLKAQNIRHRQEEGGVRPVVQGFQNRE